MALKRVNQPPPADPPKPAIAFQAFGVPLSIEFDEPALQGRVEAVLPPGREQRGSVPESHRFRLASRNGVSYRVIGGGESLAGSSDLDVALEVLAKQLRTFVAIRAPDHIFVHAGVVGWGGRAIVIPGMTFTGKTTLVAELVRAGAEYYSDEFAPIDPHGRIHPYPKPLSIRPGDGSWSQVDHDSSHFGTAVGAEPIPVGVVAIAPYSPGVNWSPMRLSTGEGVLALLANTIPAHQRPAEAMTALGAAAANAIVLEGERGEARDVVEALLELAERDPVPPRTNGVG
jgi:hypothetical protein